MVNEQDPKNANANEDGERKEESPENIEKIKAEVDETLKKVAREGEEKERAVEIAGGTNKEYKEMQTNVKETNERAEEAGEEYEEEVQLEQTAGFVEKNYAEIEKTTLKILERLKVGGISADAIKEAMIDELVKALENKKLLEGLKDEGLISEDEAATIFMIAPFVKNAIEASKEKGDDDIKSVFEDPEQNLEYIATAGVLLEKLSKSGKFSDPKTEFVIKSLSRMLLNGTFQKFLSEFMAGPNKKGEENVEQG